MRMGNDFLSRQYKNVKFEKIEKKSDLQDLQFGGRLSKGDTYLIGEGDKEKFFLTQYKDGSVELWMRKMLRNTLTEETIVCLTEYEAECIYTMIDNIFMVLLAEKGNGKTIQTELATECSGEKTVA